MSLTELIHFDKDGEPEKTGWRGLVLEKLFLALVIILVATLGFGVGRLTGGEESEPVRIEYDSTLTTNYPQPTTENAASAIQALPEGGVVVSKSGSKYHYPYCTGAKHQFRFCQRGGSGWLHPRYQLFATLKYGLTKPL